MALIDPHYLTTVTKIIIRETNSTYLILFLEVDKSLKNPEIWTKFKGLIRQNRKEGEG